jgi:WhiB family redox-sensing transcriptional regulator
MSVDLFFPERGNNYDGAKQTCAQCPVRGACADYAKRTGTNYGIWGGVVLKRYQP